MAETAPVTTYVPRRKKKKVREQMDTRFEGADPVQGLETKYYGPESIQRKRMIGPTSPNHRAKSHKKIRTLLDND